MDAFGNQGLGGLGNAHWSCQLRVAARRSVFVSYHHHGDSKYYTEFSRIFQDAFAIVRDNSLERRIDSADHEYVIRRIREEYLAGSSCTIVLCGLETPWRKYIDWEICATLNKGHGLIGVRLPTNPVDFSRNACKKPARLQDNIDSGYAVWAQWHDLVRQPSYLRTLVEDAVARSATLIRNARDLRRRDGSNEALLAAALDHRSR